MTRNVTGAKSKAATTGPGAATRATRTPESIYQLKIVLADTNPRIWRRVLVPTSITLPRLHRVFQIAMGWGDYHLHEFEIGGQRFQPEPEPIDEFDTVRNENRVRLDSFHLSARSRFTYDYDFGDSWSHVITVEKILPSEPGRRYPICLEGERAGPPEDCGGVPGYEEFLSAISDPEHAEHDEMLGWIGGEFDPDEFDLEAVNRDLKRL